MVVEVSFPKIFYYGILNLMWFGLAVKHQCTCVWINVCASPWSVLFSQLKIHASVPGLPSPALKTLYINIEMNSARTHELGDVIGLALAAAIEKRKLITDVHLGILHFFPCSFTNRIGIGGCF